MDNENIIPFTIAPIDTGCRNQILGAFRAISELTGNQYDFEKLFVLPKDCENFASIKTPLNASQFSSYKEFSTYIYSLLDNYMSTVTVIPNVFITVYNLTETLNAGEDADKICRAIKEYYEKKHLGIVLTAVLTSRFHKYKYADLINIPKHLLTFSARIRLLRHKNFRKKVLITLGTVNNFHNKLVHDNYKELSKRLSKLKNNADIKPFIDKLDNYKNKTKHVVFCLGGRVESSDILFDLSYAQHLYDEAKKLIQNGYGIIFVNGPRTPNNITDFLYEKAKKNPNIIFQNSKKIAKDDEERQPSKWRIYSGKYEKELATYEKIGNIYPGILAIKNTLVVHSMDSYSSCETSSAGIPTAVSCKEIFVNPDSRYDCHNLVKLLCPKYAVDFNEFVQATCNMKIEPKDLRLNILPSPLRIFAEMVINQLNHLCTKDITKRK